MTAVDAEISLRPLSLRPGGANPFAGFAKGAGAGLKNKAVTSQPVEERRKKPAGEVIRYSRDFLMKFVQKYTRVPQELQYSNSDILLAADDPGREQQQQLLQRVAADEADERDWRARSTLPPAPASAQQQQQQQQPPQQPQPGWRPDQQPSSSAAAPTPAAGGPEVAKVQRATDIGRTAWHAGEATEGADQTLRKVKGILNKLTPEKFERLLSQLIPMVSGYEVLQGTIHQVFENAVQQPTFVAMYADLCRELDAVLPEFRAPGEDKPTGFKKMLANTCQAEYEATEEARKLKSLPAEERYDAERRAKQRLLGNIRLIAELFNKAQVNDRIMLLILADLLGGPDNDPPEDSVEAVCELLAIAGAELEKGAKGKARLDAAFRQVERMSNATKAYASRIRFVMKDVLELRHQHWVARRETFTAKKLDDIRSEAQAELGIVDMPIAGLESLAGSLPPLAAKRAEEVDLFPAFKSSEAGWAAARGKGEAAGTQKFSAFLGDYVAVAHEVAAVAAPVSTARAPRTDLSDDERQSLGKSLFSDYLSSPDLDEAVGTAQELEAPGFQHKLVQIGLEKAFDAMTEKEQLSLVDLLAALAARGVLAADDLKQGTAALLEQLEDLALDIPSAPRLLGRLLGAAAAGGLLGLDWVAGAASGCESAEPRRAYVAAVLKAVAEAGGEEQLVAACGEAKLDLASLLAFDAEFDGDLEAPADFLRAQGLPAIA